MARGWDAPDKFACADCVNNKHLKNAIRESADASYACNYCSSRRAAHLSVILQPIGETLNRYFQSPDESGVPRDAGDWVIPPIDTRQALMDLGLACDDDLLDDLAQAFLHNDCWIPGDGHWAIPHKRERLANAWDHFEEVVKHRARYFLGSDIEEQAFHPENESFKPTDLLEAVGRAVNGLDLIYTLEPKLKLYRARRCEKGAVYKSFEGLGPPPKDAARAGRMNAAGIPYFYLARERRTAIGEVVSRPPGKLAIGEFELNRAVPVLDLTELPDPPSVFNDEAYEERQLILFLHYFVDRIASPIEKDGREHTEFVPSQVVSEYFSRIFGSADHDGRIGGMVYPSTLVPTGQNVVVFPPRNRDNWEEIATLVSTEELEFENWKEVLGEMQRVAQ